MSDSNQISKLDSNLISESQLKLAGSLVLAKRLPKDERPAFFMACDRDAKDPTTLLVISLFLGGLGVDRFVLGQTVLGLLKLFTAGGIKDHDYSIEPLKDDQGDRKSVV